MSTPDETPAADVAPSAPPPPAPSSEDSVERVRKIYVRDLREKEHLHTVFRVARKQRTQGRSGKAFLSLVLADRTGEVDGRIFDEVDKKEPTFAAEDFVLLRGEVISFHGKPQVVISEIERLDPEPIDPQEFAFTAAPAVSAATSAPAGATDEPVHEGTKVVPQIRELLERVQDPYVRSLLLALLDDPEVAAGLPTAPAARGVPHSYRGGLADHILSTLKLAHRLAEQYPMADRDLLVAGAFLHHLGKVKELAYEKGGVDYTDEGRLVGHLVITAQKIHLHASRLPGFPPALEHHLTHLVLASPGEQQDGAPKVAVTLEALLVHQMQALDTKVQSWLELMSRDGNERWTEHSRLYDRQLYKGPAPTARGKAPTEGRRRPARDRNRDRDRKRAEVTRKERPPRGASPATDKPAAAKPAPERDPSLPKDLTFKPFHTLTEGEAK